MPLRCGPKEFGGLSGEVWMQTVIRSELVRYRLPTVSINLLGVGLAGPTLIAHGTQAQKERYLRKILSARRSGASSSVSPARGPTWRRCRRGPCATATSGS